MDPNLAENARERVLVVGVTRRDLQSAKTTSDASQLLLSRRTRLSELLRFPLKRNHSPLGGNRDLWKLRNKLELHRCIISERSQKKTITIQSLYKHVYCLPDSVHVLFVSFTGPFWLISILSFAVPCRWDVLDIRLKQNSIICTARQSPGAAMPVV